MEKSLGTDTEKDETQVEETTVESVAVKEKKHLFVGPDLVPSLLTLLSACCAVMSVLCSIRWSLRAAISLIAASAVLDCFDGWFASRFERDERERAFGVEIDSLTDAVAFGIAPATFALAVCWLTYNRAYTAASTIVSFVYVIAVIVRLAWYDALAHEGREGEMGGLPVTWSALVLLAAFLACETAYVLPQTEAAVMMGTQLALSALFVLNIRVPKPPLAVRALLAIAGVGMCVALFMVTTV